jgi:hypothetical protein
LADDENRHYALVGDWHIAERNSPPAVSASQEAIAGEDFPQQWKYLPSSPLFNFLTKTPLTVTELMSRNCNIGYALILGGSFLARNKADLPRDKK